MIEYYLKNIFYYFQNYQIFDGFGNRTGNLHVPSPVLYRSCYGHLILFVLIQPYLLCNIISPRSLRISIELAMILPDNLLMVAVFLYCDMSPNEGIKTSVAIRSIAWEDVKKGKELTGSSIARNKIISPDQCALKCGKTSLCRSFNFCSPNWCDLNSEDVFSIGRNFSLFEDSQACTYHGMKKNDIPFCQEGVEEKYVQDDENPGLCEINQKRVDLEWTSWRWEVVIDSQDEFKEMKRREKLVDFAHGGIAGTNETGPTKYWLKFVATPMNWLSAKDDCKNLGG